MTNHPNRKPTATLDTYRDITSAWIVAQLRADDTLKVTYRSRWQGSTDGRTVLFRYTGLNLAIASASDEQDADAMIEGYLTKMAEIGNDGRLLKRGFIVR